MGLLLEQAVDD
ncbi:hypothetical protein EYZ11_000327 [Aspergillus tanneri]|uniref:Uncharacterized protein n=1 Tax=Aspergillus tanneri TaxID=1220188 RepID=A0A4S3JXB8_9EURO|nr:hypothetical protein EYZ11_000327 [Aspergillus tanneri]